MESRFSHLRQRDTSVSMLRVKMSRRRSQSQKENRDRAVNTRRQLDKLPEHDVSSLDASMAMANMSIIKEATKSKPHAAKNEAVEERLKQLERWKERKVLEKEKEKREKERKGVFKTGLYHHTDTFTIVTAPAASRRGKEVKVNTALSQSTRVTRSMKQPQVQQTLKLQDIDIAKKGQPVVERSTRSRMAPAKSVPVSTRTKVCAVEPTVRALSTRSANRPPVTAVPAVKDKPKDKAAGARATRSRAIINSVAPPSGKDKNSKECMPPPPPKEPELQVQPHSSTSEEENMVVDQDSADSVPAVDVFEAPPASSFAPHGFVFNAPVGLSSFKFEPLTPRSAGAFHVPSTSFNLPPVPAFHLEPQAAPCKPSPPKSPRRSPARSSATGAPPTTGSPMDTKHDVPYFRSEIVSETDRLTALCVQWECKVEDESIPEEMRDCMRTTIGQARLLMNERFKQFGGLVDDCDLGRGEKITTCTDLQGFWDMVYYQVEDVNKKFEALKEAEGRGWVEEHKPPPRQRKVVKKPAAAPAKPPGTKAGAKSRLAAAKAAMKARQQAAEGEKVEESAAKSEEDPGLNCDEPKQTEAQATDVTVFDGGFFQVVSPAKTPVSVRRSSRLSAALPPQASPPSNHFTPRRVTRRSLALTPAASPARSVLLTPAPLHLALEQTPKSRRGTPQTSQRRRDAANVSVCPSPVKAELLDDAQPEETAAEHAETLDEAASVLEASAATPARPPPSITVVEEREEPAEAVYSAVSPCCSPPPPPAVSQAAEPSAALSFTLSPCASPSEPPSSPLPPAVQGHIAAPDSLCCTPDTSVVEGIPALDFERYLQPSHRGSLSPRVLVATETLSPMAVDVESPRGQHDDHLLTQHEAVSTVEAVPSPLAAQSPQIQSQSAECDMLLFTPTTQDRIRQSVCPSDLMVFTPPL